MHWVPTGQTVNKEYYVEVLKEFRKRFRRKRPALFKSGSVAFLPGQCTSAQLHPCHRLFDQRWASKQFVILPIVQTLLPVTFGYSLSLEAVMKVFDTLTHDDFHGAFQKLLEWYKCIATGGDYFMCVLSIKVPIQKKSGNLLVCSLYISLKRQLVKLSLILIIKNTWTILLINI